MKGKKLTYHPKKDSKLLMTEGCFRHKAGILKSYKPNRYNI